MFTPVKSVFWFYIFTLVFCLGSVFLQDIAAQNDVPPIDPTRYDAAGGLVRTLTLGHQPEGFYHSQSRAAYWDGRNALGERVASGVYFYQLTTDTFQQTRRMIILK